MILFILLFSYPLQKSLSLHLDASKIINIANGSYLMKWNDISGNSRNAIPIFGQNGAIFVNGTENDDPYLHFDGTSGYHVEDEIGSLTNMSIFVVHQPIFDGSRVGEYTDIVDSQGDVTKLFADDNGVYVINAFTTIGFHTYIVPQSIESIDVLVVAGGGGGGSDNGGGGGAGGLVFQSNIIVVPGSSYRLNVGSGGIGSTINVGGGKNGDNSAFGTIIGIGGGSGGEGECGVQKAKSGGSGGGGHGESKTCLSESNGATGLQPSSSSGGFGNSGGNGGTAGDNGGGGGGGAGSVGGNGNTTHGGVGGSGKYFGDIFGTFFGDNGWFSGGGGGGSQNTCSGCVNFGGLGGGGMGGPISDIHGRPNTGGGGGGRGYTSSNSEKGGNGGSGIVLIRHKINTINMRNLISAGYSLSQGDKTLYIDEWGNRYSINTFTTVGSHLYIVPNNTRSLEVIVVGGGGGGGADNGGGGGGGGIAVSDHYVVEPNTTYPVKVGKGGTGATINQNDVKNGEDSAFGTIIGIGGGSGGEGECGVQKAMSGGSGGGGHGESKTCLSESNGATGLQPSSSSGGFGNSGGNGGTAGDNGGGGGGGAGSVGGNGNTTHGGVGGSGKYFGDIFGTFFGDNGWFSGGGGGGSQNKCSGCVNFGGLGGGGMGGPISNIHGRPNTGGGGGGRGFTSSYSEKGGNGGSGIVMVKSLHQSIFDVTYNDKEISINVSNSKAVIPLNVLCCENSILSIIFDENTARVWVDHMFQTSISPQNLMKANQWFIGSSLGSYFKGKISEVIVFNRSLTLNEKDEVELYIKNKWKTKTILPSNPRRFHRHFMIILFSFII